ncbi:hypothetical protein KI387_042219, partial [Taxus chinensis]
MTGGSIWSGNVRNFAPDVIRRRYAGWNNTPRREGSKDRMRQGMGWEPDYMVVLSHHQRGQFKADGHPQHLIIHRVGEEWANTEVV